METLKKILEAARMERTGVAVVAQFSNLARIKEVTVYPVNRG